MLAQEFAKAPVESGTGLVPIMIGRGRVAFEISTTGGPGDFPRLAVAVDAALAIAVHRGTPAPSAGPTLDLRIDQVAGPAQGSTKLSVDGEYLGTSQGAGTGRVIVRDGEGTIVAHAVGTMVVEAPIIDRAARLARFDGVPLFAPDEFAEQMRRVPVLGGRVRLPLTRSLTNLRGSVHGGLVLALGSFAQDRIPGPPTRTLSTAVEYLRPLPAEGTVTCHVQLVRDGRRFRSLRSELVLDDGRTAAVVTTTREVHR
jgi:acyl-coenzyme A thioesterase PaaI-like protein